MKQIIYSRYEFLFILILTALFMAFLPSQAGARPQENSRNLFSPLSNEAADEAEAAPDKSVKTSSGAESEKEAGRLVKKEPAPATYSPPAFLTGARGTDEVLAALKKEFAKDGSIIDAHLKSRLNSLLNSPREFDFNSGGASLDTAANEIAYPYIDIRLKDALFDSLNVETASINIKGISFDAYALFALGKLRVKSQKEIAADINIAESDLNAYLKNKAEKIKVRRPYVRFDNGKLVFGGTFKYGLFVIKFDANGVFKIVENTKIHFDIKRLEVNQVRMPSGFVKKIILKINPIMDLEKFPFKLVMKTIAVSDKYLIFSSK